MKITSDFPNLPPDENPDFEPRPHLKPTWAEERARLYGHVFADLAALGHPVPSKPADQITRAELLHHLQTIAHGLVKQYEVKPKHIDPEDGFHRALHRLPYAPNELSDQDLKAAGKK